MKLCLYLRDGFNWLVTAGTEAYRWHSLCLVPLALACHMHSFNHQLSTKLSVIQ